MKISNNKSIMSQLFNQAIFAFLNPLKKIFKKILSTLKCYVNKITPLTICKPQ